MAVHANGSPGQRPPPLIGRDCWAHSTARYRYSTGNCSGSLDRITVKAPYFSLHLVPYAI